MRGSVFAKFVDVCPKASRCPLLAQIGHPSLHRTCPLLGVKRTSACALHMSAFRGKADIMRGIQCPLLLRKPTRPVQLPNINFAETSS